MQEFGYSKEIEDRVLAPMPIRLVAVQKIVTGAVHGLVAAAFVFPIAAVVPATKVHLSVHWGVLLTLAPLAAWVAASLGLVLGTRVAPQNVSYLFALVVLPPTFLGAIYYPWQALSAIRWLQVLVLLNPLGYMCEGFRAALTQGVHHMPLPAVYLALVAFAAVFTRIGIDGFLKHNRVTASKRLGATRGARPSRGQARPRPASSSAASSQRMRVGEARRCGTRTDNQGQSANGDGSLRGGSLVDGGLCQVCRPRWRGGRRPAGGNRSAATRSAPTGDGHARSPHP